MKTLTITSFWLYFLSTVVPLVGAQDIAPAQDVVVESNATKSMAIIVTDKGAFSDTLVVADGMVEIDIFSNGTFHLMDVVVTYEGLGWLGLGFSNTGLMIGSNAVVGLPDEPETNATAGIFNPTVYDLAGKSITSVMESRFDSVKNQLQEGSTIMQNETHTVLSFTVNTSILPLPEEQQERRSLHGEEAHVFNQETYLLYAAGTNNNLTSFHIAHGSIMVSFESKVPDDTSSAQFPSFPLYYAITIGTIVVLLGM